MMQISRFSVRMVFAACAYLGLSACEKETPVSGFDTLTGEPPVIIAHRGASGYLPEHTLEAYQRAIELGADFIEPDLVLTRDGVLVARHDAYLSTTTDITDRPEFAGFRRYHETFGRTDWWIEDLTIAQVKTLRARQAFPGRSTAHDGDFAIPTFEEILALVAEMGRDSGRPVGVYPETKHPSYFASRGLDFVPRLLAVLEDALFHAGHGRIFIQSFEAGILRDLNKKADYSLVMLIHPSDATGAAYGGQGLNISLQEAARFADAVGPSKSLLLDKGGKSTGFVEEAHALGLLVHPWTFRDDQLPEQFESPLEEYYRYFRLGVDGLFTDFTDTAVEARDSFPEAAQ